ncbi:ectoine/hydroxyectoine ABC transporter substrate-binding protein EhuB [Paenalcaligenes niemegkensis]|uniref:ectoine/hydroxyectoine ABC transporter substrate-binding protein EhuB n=1 Tax=Paenalcaligenes niemegkensis TaxID=2895469 RepID=UPI001EE8D8A0|nr:ectoine/hydroxyectoine ABC transporter substrate-binding protein EhuB [Paenalcaligenes niemegkensis]MCQ9616816.1 ectoine/hydroxyectoine ABC transporter substrate-binding protein EhuB [Paenalcaligenes niemegkensis]
MRLKTLSSALTAITATTMLTIAGAAHASTLEEVQERGAVRIAVANEIPYGYMDLNGDAKGAGPDVAKAIMKNLGIDRIEWSTTNFGSLIPGLQANRFDIVAAEMAILPERCKQVLYSEPNSSYGEGLMVAKGNPNDIHAFEDFSDSDYKIAIMAGADQLEMMQALGVDESRMVTISSNADAISTVATGRADAYAATSLTASELASKSDKVEVAANFSDPIIDGEPVRSWGGFAFAQNSESLRDAVNEELKKFKETQEWSDILSSYGFTDADLEASTKRSTSQLCES